MIRRSKRITVAIAGALLYATAGGLMGASNAGWMAREPDGGAFLAILGIGAGFVVVMFAGTNFSRALARSGMSGRLARAFLVAGPVLYVLGGMIEFAILGTFALAIGLFSLTSAVFQAELGAPADRVLIALSAIGSITWNTETTSAFLLVAVGGIWAVLSVRLTRNDAVRLDQNQ